MCACASWTIKKAEHRRIDAFELWCWRRLLRVPWTARPNQFILKEISPEYSLEGLMLKLKLQYFGHLMWRTDSLEKTLILGKIEGGRRGWLDEMFGWHYPNWLDGHEFEQALGMVMDREAWHAAVYGVAESDMTEQLNWTERLNCKVVCCCLVSKSCPILLWPHGVQPARLYSWDFPTRNTGVGCHFLFQEIFLI